MKVLHVYRDLFTEGGVPYQTRRLVIEQKKIFNDIGAIFLRAPSHRSANDFCLKHSLEFTRNFPEIWRTRSFIKQWSPDIAHISGLWIPIHQICVLEIIRASIPYVITIHGHLSPLGTIVRFGGKRQNYFHVWRKKFWNIFADRPLLRYASSVLVHSPYEAGILEDFGVKNISVLPIGIDAEPENSSDKKPRRLHRPITFLHLGRLDIYHKGLDLICQALLEISFLDCQKMKVIYVGPAVGDSKKDLQEYACTLANGVLEIRDAVWGAEKEKLWEEVDYFLNVYRFAGMALAPAEAVARGVPLISSLEGNFGNWVSDWNMGFVVPLESSAIRKMFLSILDLSCDEYERLSENAKAFSRNYTWESVAHESLGIYQKAIS